MDEITKNQNPENTGNIATPEAQTGDNQTPNLENSKPSEDNSVIREMRKQLKEATKKVSQYEQKEQELTQAEQLKKGEYEKVIFEKDKAIAEAQALIASFQKEKVLNETLTKSNANLKYLDLIKANLAHVSDDELGEKVEELKIAYPEFFSSDKLTLPAQPSNFGGGTGDKTITKAQYEAMLARGENAIELRRQGYTFNF